MSTLTKAPKRKRRELSPAQQVHRLWQLSGGMVNVSYSPGSFTPDDPDAKGHLYMGYWDPPESPADDGDSFYMDDRKGPLAPQLAAELRRFADCLIATARKLESEAAHV
jgi:hypothetical protein